MSQPPPPWTPRRLALSVAIPPLWTTSSDACLILALGLTDTTRQTTHPSSAGTLAALSQLSFLQPATCPASKRTARSSFDLPLFRIHHGIASSGCDSSAQRTPWPDVCLPHPQLTRHASPCAMHPERPEPVSSEGIVPRPSTNGMRHSQRQAATSSSTTTACTLPLRRHPANHNTPYITSTPSSPTPSACLR